MNELMAKVLVEQCLALPGSAKYVGSSVEGKIQCFVDPPTLICEHKIVT